MFKATISGNERSILDSSNLNSLGYMNIGEIESDLDSFVDDCRQRPYTVYEGNIDGFKKIPGVDQTIKKQLIASNRSEMQQLENELAGLIEESGLSPGDFRYLHKLYLYLFNYSEKIPASILFGAKVLGKPELDNCIDPVLYRYIPTQESVNTDPDVIPRPPEINIYGDGTKPLNYKAGPAPYGEWSKGVEYSPQKIMSDEIKKERIRDYFECYAGDDPEKIIDALLQGMKYDMPVYLYQSGFLRDNPFYNYTVTNKLKNTYISSDVLAVNQYEGEFSHGSKDNTALLIDNGVFKYIVTPAVPTLERLNYLLRIDLCKLFSNNEYGKLLEPKRIIDVYIDDAPKRYGLIAATGGESWDSYHPRYLNRAKQSSDATYANIERMFNGAETILNDIHFKLYGQPASDIENAVYNLTLNGELASYIGRLKSKLFKNGRSHLSYPFEDLFNNYDIDVGVGGYSFYFEPYSDFKKIAAYCDAISNIVPKSLYKSASAVSNISYCKTIASDYAVYISLGESARNIYFALFKLNTVLMLVIGPIIVIVQVIIRVVNAIGRIFGASVSENPPSLTALFNLFEDYASGAIAGIAYNFLKDYLYLLVNFNFNITYILRALVCECLSIQSIDNINFDYKPSKVKSEDHFSFIEFKESPAGFLGRTKEPLLISDDEDGNFVTYAGRNASGVFENFSLENSLSRKDFELYDPIDDLIGDLRSSLMSKYAGVIEAYEKLNSTPANKVSEYSSDENNFGKFLSVTEDSASNSIQFLRFGSGLSYTRKIAGGKPGDWRQTDISRTRQIAYSFTKGDIDMIPLGSKYAAFDTLIDRLRPNEQNICFVIDEKACSLPDSGGGTGLSYTVETYFSGSLYTQTLYHNTSNNKDWVSNKGQSKYIYTRTGSLFSESLIVWNEWIRIQR